MADAAPIPMLLWCPQCSHRHIDCGSFALHPHHTHACQDCGLVWRPALVATVGVAFLPGFRDPEASLTTRQVLTALAQRHPQGATVAQICTLAKWPSPDLLYRLVRSGRIVGVGGDRYRVHDA